MLIPIGLVEQKDRTKCNEFGLNFNALESPIILDRLGKKIQL